LILVGLEGEMDLINSKINSILIAYQDVELSWGYWLDKARIFYLLYKKGRKEGI
jgi:hypothetical protein